MAKATKKVRFAAIRKAYNNRAQIGSDVADVASKVWTLTVVGVLWGSAYTIFMCSQPGVPVKVQQLLAGALAALGLMFLFVNLRSVKNSDVVE